MNERIKLSFRDALFYFASLRACDMCGRKHPLSGLSIAGHSVVYWHQFRSDGSIKLVVTDHSARVLPTVSVI